jgi:polygalacturonase/pectin methylesterase-like acyl-CoA thioesterase
MIRVSRFPGLLAACCVLATMAPAQTAAFKDTFTGASTVNANPSSPLFSTSTAASYQQLSAKSFSPNPPAITPGNLRFGIVATTSGFNSIQALFTKYPVTLVATGDYLELKVVFNTEGGIITAQTNSTLFFGLFNAGQIQPVPGGLNGTINTALTGYAQTWTGYVNRIFYTGGNNAFFTRPAQTAAGLNNQDLLFQYTAAAQVGSNALSAVPAFTANATYTEVFRVTKTGATTLSLSSSLYAGATATGPALYTQTAATTATTTLTNVFDAFSFGWRSTVNPGVVSTMNVKSVTVTTTGTTTIIPEISTQPLSVTKSVGENHTFTVVADGGAGTTLSYQWQLNGAPIPGATGASYAIPAAALTDAGDYTVVVSDAAGSTTSSVATLTVTTGAVAPSIIVQSTGGSIITGGSFTFSATVNGTAPLAYRWERSTDNGATYTPIGGATAASYTLSGAALTDAGLYRLAATNSVGSATSDAVTLNVNAAPAITNQPVGGSISPGGSITLSVTATGNPAPTYQWKKNGSPISGATGLTYTISGATGADTGSYTVVATNSVGSVTSAPATVAVVSASMAATATTPASSGTRNPDTRLTITFNQTPTVGVQGYIRIYDAANDTVVDTIDLVAATALRDTLRASSTLSTQLLPVQTKPIGGIVTNFDYYPVTISGNTATIYPRNGVLAYGKTYYVKVEAGAFVNASGEAFAGITDAATWRFSTKTAGPASGATRLTVAADGTGDFDTVQAALDFIPANNTTPTVINVKNGTYFEQVAFQSKHFVTVVGQDSDQTVIVYPNNNTFNNVSGVYHRGTFLAQSVHDFTIANLTVSNSTPQNGSQAEALIINGSSPTVGHNIVTRCKFYSYQDTVQFNKQTYVSDSTIWGDVDFMWGDGPAFLENCDIRILRSGSYFTQIRNGSGNHGYVFVNCRFTAPAGITGTFLGRIDPTAANFPFSEVVVLDSTFGDPANNAFLNTTSGVSGANYLGGWWLLNNVGSASGAPTVHNWTNHLVNATGNALTNPNADAFTTMPTDAATQANYRNAAWVLNSNLAGTVNGTWTPALAPVIVTQPTALTVNAGDPATFSVGAFAVPAPSYQWRRNGADIPGATGASYTINATSPTDADTYSVVVTNSAGTVTSNAVTLLVNGGPPVITQHPITQSAFAGTNASFSVFAVGNGPFTYQWFKNGAPIAGASGASLLLANVQAADAASYTATVSNANGSDTSHVATLTIATPYNQAALTLPTIPTTLFRVTDYGAVGDGATDNTAAIAATIAAAKTAGGGIIEFPAAPGAYLSGPIALSSNLNLQIDGGAILRALPLGTYPNPNTHFITVASGSSNVAITGNGTIDGQGAAWWTAFDAGQITSRPRLVQFTKTTNVLITGVTLLNSPNFNLAFSGANSNVTIYGVSVIAPGDSPNTDGMDLSGTNFLVQNCYVSVGDDNVVGKPGSVFCSNIVVANCAFGTGHGVSIGGQTNAGLDGMLVTDCTFDGTSSALRLKADPTQGGPVQNVTFQNLTMKNVQYPILFYSYYNQLGSPGAVSGSSQTTAAKVNTWNAQPPNSLASTTIPTWKNITVRNLTVTNGSGYSTIWGLPTASALIQNVTLENVSIQGGAGLELYDAANIQLTGTNSVGPIITCNALAITGQPVARTVDVGGSVSFSATAVGGSGTNNTGITYRWNLDGNPLSDGPQVDGSIVSGATSATLTIANARVTKAGSYTLTASTNLDGFNLSTNALVANSLPVSATSAGATLTVNPVPASVALAGLDYIYDGNAKVPVVATSPANLAVTLTYNGDPAAPVNAGSYAVVATIADPNYFGSAAATLTIAKATPALAWAAPAAIVYGTPLGAAQLNATSDVPGAFAYTPSAGTVLAAGAGQSLTAVFTPADTDNFNGGTVATTLAVEKATPTLAWSAPVSITYGAALGSTQLNATANVAGSFAYTPAAGTVLSAGPNQPLSAVFSPADSANYNGGTVATTLTVDKAVADVLLGNLAQTYTGSPKSVTVTTTPANLAVAVTYAASPTPPTAAGSYLVVATVNDANYSGAASSTLVIAKAASSVSLSPLTQTYDGTPRAVTATTVPAGLPVTVTYDNGSATAPIYPGAHPVTATVNDGNYQATFTATLNITITALVRHAPTLNGLLAGSIQVLSAESTTLNGNAALSGDLLMPGTPSVVLNGRGSLGATINGPGAAQPASHSLTLGGNALVPVLVRRVDAIALPVVSAPPTPAGSRSVALNRSTDSAGDFATVRNLTLNGNAGRVVLPAGSYGDCVANGNSSLVLGVEGAATPAVYNLQNLVLNGGSKLELAGPVVLTLANGTTINGIAGSAAHPAWLELRIAAGGLTLNANAELHGRVVAPGGTVIINGNAALHGSVAADGLTINANAELDDEDDN